MENNILELLTSASILCGIGMILAFLLELSGKYLGDYGERRIIINNEKEVIVNGGSPLLTTLKEEKIYIPSACGGKGTCAYCKVKIHEGGGPVLPTETPYLSSEEVAQNIRLSCQLKVKENLHIEIPEELFLVKQLRAKVFDIIELTPEIKELKMNIVAPEEGIKFRPGQYIQLEVPKYGNVKDTEFRAYSISSDSRHQNTLELVITKIPDGAVTTYVHEYLHKNDDLTLYGPYGDFYLRESDRGIIMIATGSGLAPMISILHQIENDKIKRNTALFFGAKTRNDLYYNDKLREFEKNIDAFKFYPVLSRSEDDAEWLGERGRVTDLIEKFIPDNDPVDVYLCGSPQMIESCMELLATKGIPEKNMYFDKFE